MKGRCGEGGQWLLKYALLLTLVGMVLGGMPATAQEITWEEYTIPIEDLHLSDLVFVDEDIGWGVGWIDLDPGTRPPQYVPTIVHTTDGGKTWTKQETGFEGLGSLNAVCFIDGETGVAVGQDWDTGAPLILWTANGGNTWTGAPVSRVRGALINVTFTEDGTGWSVGVDFGTSESLILRSTNGRTWTKQSHPTQKEARLSAIVFPTTMVGYAVGGIGWESPKPFVLKTADSGDTWTEVVPPLAEASLNDAFFLDDQTGWVVGSSGDDGIVLKTTDGGASWEVIRVHGSSLYFKRVVFLDLLRGFGLVRIKRGDKYFSAVYETLDGGITWQKLYETTWYITCLNVCGNTLRVVTGREPGGPTILEVPTGTATVHVNPPELTRIDVTPPEVTLNVNEQQQFQATGHYDGRDSFPVKATWSTTGGSIDSNTGLYTATTARTFTVTASVSGGVVTDTATVHVNPPELTRIDVTPPEVTLNVNEQQQFQAKGYDAQGNEVPITPGWSACGGTITTGGLYTSPTEGEFTITASVEGNTVTGTATVHVNPPELTRIDVTPPEVTLNVNEQQQFQAKGYDAQGNEIPITPGWSAAGGTITTSGVYKATDVGDFTVTAAVSGSSVIGKATVHVKSPGSHVVRINVSPRRAILYPGKTQQFKATGYDRYGDVVPFTPIWNATGGRITQEGLYTATIAGDFTVTCKETGTNTRGTANVYTMGSLCYPPSWNVITVDTDRFVVNDPTGKVLAGCRFWDDEMGPTARDFINNYLALKPEGTKIGEIVPANLGGRPGLSTTFTYPWGSIEKIIVVILEDGTPVKLFIEGPPNLVTEYVSMGYYAQMADCCQFP